MLDFTTQTVEEGGLRFVDFVGFSTNLRPKLKVCRMAAQLIMTSTSGRDLDGQLQQEQRWTDRAQWAKAAVATYRPAQKDQLAHWLAEV